MHRMKRGGGSRLSQMGRVVVAHRRKEEGFFLEGLFLGWPFSWMAFFLECLFHCVLRLLVCPFTGMTAEELKDSQYHFSESFLFHHRC